MTREEAVKGLKVLRKEFSGYKPNEEMFDMAIEALKAQEWVPCSERVPNKEGSYLITSETGAVTTAHWYMPSEWKPNGYWGRNGKKKTLAWMPLPDPWNGGEEE